jgi:hypothetical protein
MLEIPSLEWMAEHINYVIQDQGCLRCLNKGLTEVEYGEQKVKRKAELHFNPDFVLDSSMYLREFEYGMKYRCAQPVTVGAQKDQRFAYRGRFDNTSVVKLPSLFPMLIRLHTWFFGAHIPPYCCMILMLSVYLYYHICLGC